MKKHIRRILLLSLFTVGFWLVGYSQRGLNEVEELLTRREWVLFKKSSAFGDEYPIPQSYRIALNFFPSQRFTGKCEDILKGDFRSNPFFFEWYLVTGYDKEPQLIIRNKELRRSKNPDNFIFFDPLREKTFNIRIIFTNDGKQVTKEGKQQIQLRFTPINENKEITTHYYFR